MRPWIAVVVFLVACRSEWSVIDKPIDDQSMASLDSHLSECGFATARGERKARCAEVALHAARYIEIAKDHIELDMACYAARKAGRFADHSDPRWAAVEATLTAKCNGKGDPHGRE